MNIDFDMSIIAKEILQNSMELDPDYSNKPKVLLQSNSKDYNVQGWAANNRVDNVTKAQWLKPDGAVDREFTQDEVLSLKRELNYVAYRSMFCRTSEAYDAGMEWIGLARSLGVDASRKILIPNSNQYISIDGDAPNISHNWRNLENDTVVRELSGHEMERFRTGLRCGLEYERRIYKSNLDFTKSEQADLNTLGMFSSDSRKSLAEKKEVELNSFKYEGKSYLTDKPFMVFRTNSGIEVEDGGRCTVPGFVYGLKRGFTSVFNEGSENHQKFQAALGNDLHR